MAKLTAAQRRNAPASAFVYPRQRAYYIGDEKHARAALLISAQKKTFGDPATVRRAVKKRYPHLVKGGSDGR